MAEGCSSDDLTDRELMPPPLLSLPPPPLPPLPPGECSQSMRRVMKPERLTTDDVVTAFILHRLQRKFGPTGTWNFCLDKLRKVEDSPTFRILNKMDKIMTELPAYRCMLTHIRTSAFRKIKSKEYSVLTAHARASYTGALISCCFRDRKLDNPSYSWWCVTTALSVSASLAASVAGTGDYDRVRDYIEWCSCFFKTWHINNWIEGKGGWESIKEDGKGGLRKLAERWQAQTVEE